MTDHELLEMAAKAAGYEIKRYSERCGAVECLVDGVSMWWDPLTNDGEALRLAVKLGIHITNNQSDAWATALDAIAIEPLIMTLRRYPPSYRSRCCGDWEANQKRPR